MTTDNTLDDALAGALAEITGEDVETDEAVAEETVELEDDNSDGEVDEAADAEAEDLDEDEEVEPEASDEEEADEEDEEQSELLELSEDDVVIIDGQEVSVKEALLMQSDYTKKTQALAEERKAFEAEREQLSAAVETMNSLDEAWGADPSGVVATFLSNSDDVIDTTAEAIAQLAQDGEVDANSFVVKSIVALVQADLLDDELVQMLGFDDEMVSRMKADAQRDSRIRKLEKQARTPKAPARSQDEVVAQARAELENQWNGLVDKQPALSAMDADAQNNVKVEVAKLALERGGIPLDVAWELLEADRAKAEAAVARKKASAAKAKRKNKVVSKPTNASAGRQNNKPMSLDEALAEAMGDLTS